MLRKEVPPMVQRELEEALETELIDLDEKMRKKTVDIFHNCLVTVLQNLPPRRSGSPDSGVESASTPEKAATPEPVQISESLENLLPDDLWNNGHFDFESYLHEPVPPEEAAQFTTYEVYDTPT